MKALITRKEIAAMTDLSVDVIRRNEQTLGLATCKMRLNRRHVVYRRSCVITSLRAAGFILP